MKQIQDQENNSCFPSSEKKGNKWGGAREGAGRNSIYKGQNKTKIALSLVDEAAEHLTRLATEQQISRSDVVNNFLLSNKKQSSADD